ncbi:MAG: universal stress protein [Kouleothrix sp.]|nr:universal stress protein [Kouleothrix sp.]
MFKRILLATDGSPVVEREILYAEHLARVEQAELFVLHAYDPPARYAVFPGYEQLLERYHEVAQAVVDDAVNALREDGVTAQGEVRVGPAAEAIIAAAAEHSIDLIVMGTRGSGNIQSMIGSVSAQVLRQTHCPVLQIP